MRKRDEVQLVIEGPKIRPATVDPLVTLDVARTYFHLLKRIAAEQGAEFTLQGLFIRKGSTVVASRPSEPAVAVQLMTDLSRYIAGVLPAPSKLESAVQEMRGKIINLSPHVTVTARCGEEVQLLTARRVEAALPPRETVDLRAMVVSVGGAQKPAARFVSKSERRGFSLRTDMEVARALGRLLYANIDLTATIQRDEEGNIREGWLDDFRAVDTTSDELRVWREWFREAGGDWNDIEDIEGELGRV